MSSSTLEPIVTSLHWSKELQKAGWPQESYFSWYNAGSGTYILGDQVDVLSLAVRVGYQSTTAIQPFDQFAAPTAEEILWRLPLDVVIHRNSEQHFILTIKVDGRTDAFVDVSLANAAAAMYCYLSNNKLLPYPSTK